MSFLHHAVKDENEQVVKMIKEELSFFKEIVDDDSNEDATTPLI